MESEYRLLEEDGLEEADLRELRSRIEDGMANLITEYDVVLKNEQELIEAVVEETFRTIVEQADELDKDPEQHFYLVLKDFRESDDEQGKGTLNLILGRLKGVGHYSETVSEDVNLISGAILKRNYEQMG